MADFYPFSPFLLRIIPFFSVEMQGKGNRAQVHKQLVWAGMITVDLSSLTVSLTRNYMQYLEMCTGSLS